ncbi:Rv2253/PknI dimerization domain-containing protein [Mycolicibacterium sphagni]|jgi:hypothetical protein|uniref:Secreted protein n=1 Tax=Mycolicibacterium sphagni TaxID=1786 RepID=A0A255D6K8_9MYCO|nr:hypothetical protein [Mycolicibacterium sphagni]MCV7175672.1 hypothetical protein [Mycolicibacterium sphagni]OYN74957.1 hypothetical protein CG716_27090 [Mycolicibacterium sphagni]
MLRSGTLISVAVLTAATMAGAVNPATAHASDNWALNGTFTATSNGEWATNNDVFHNEKSVRSIWTISSTCSYPTECIGTVSSDAGWTAPIFQTGGDWRVKRTLPDWMPCDDGTTAPGYQVYRFHGASPGGDQTDPSSTTLVGQDETTGVPGACGHSLALFINMPFKLVKQT